MQLSADAATALTTSATSTHLRLPARLASMLHVPLAYLRTQGGGLLAQEDGSPQSLWHRMCTPVTWLLSKPRDVSDVQWREFRGGLGPLAAAMAGFVVLSRLVRMLGQHNCWKLLLAPFLSTLIVI